jgi:uncharacterized small protein (TIGR04563 family)
VPSSPKKKVTLYFSAAMLEETQREAIRQDRSISWIIQAAWRISREDVHKLPNVAGLPVGASSPASPALPAAAGLPASATPPPVVPLPSRFKARS